MFAVRFSSMHVDSMFLYTVNPGSKSPYALCLLNHCSIVVILKKTGVEFGITGSRIWLLYLLRWLLQMRTYFCLGGCPPEFFRTKSKPQWIQPRIRRMAQFMLDSKLSLEEKRQLGGEAVFTRRVSVRRRWNFWGSVKLLQVPVGWSWWSIAPIFEKLSIRAWLMNFYEFLGLPH